LDKQSGFTLWLVGKFDDYSGLLLSLELHPLQHIKVGEAFSQEPSLQRDATAYSTVFKRILIILRVPVHSNIQFQ
jgi:hypothetical protein